MSKKFLVAVLCLTNIITFYSPYQVMAEDYTYTPSANILKMAEEGAFDEESYSKEELEDYVEDNASDTTDGDYSDLSETVMDYYQSEADTEINEDTCIDNLYTSSSESIPVKYNNNYNKLYYPREQSQLPWGTCWAFSTVALAEINQYLKANVTRDVDYSQLQLAWYIYNPFEKKGIEGHYTSQSFSSSVLDCGGNTSFAANLLNSWTGLTTEDKLPYSTAERSEENSSKCKYETGELTMDDSLSMEKEVILNNCTIYNIKKDGPDAIKKAIMENGALEISYNSLSGSYAYKAYKDNTGEELDKTENELYELYGNDYTCKYCDCLNNHDMNTAVRANHSIIVVGWDDEFPKEFFMYNKYDDDATDGAWLCRNSWADGSASSNMDQYLWIAYDDCSIDKLFYSLDFVEENTYENNYQYDYSLIHSVNSNPVNANVYKADNCSDGEVLKAVNVSFENIVKSQVSGYEGESSYFTIKIYKNLSDENEPTSGELCLTQKEYINNPGVYTIPLDKSISLLNGEYFSVVIETDGVTKLDCEMCGQLNYLNMVSSPSNMSYYYDITEDSWVLNTTDTCIKAFTINACTDHEWVTDEAVAPSCIRNGKTAKVYCSKCGEVKTPSTLVKKSTDYHVNAYGDIKTDEPGEKCTDQVTEYKFCKICGAHYDVEYLGTYHEYLKERFYFYATGRVEATYTERGYTGDLYCQKCGELIQAGEVIPSIKEQNEAAGKNSDSQTTEDASTQDNSTDNTNNSNAADAANNSNAIDNTTDNNSSDTINDIINSITDDVNNADVSDDTEKVAVKATSIKKYTAKKTSIKITLKKIKGAKLYQLQYSTKKSFDNAKIKDIKSSYTIKNLKSKKKYYVRVRTAVVVNKHMYWSSWTLKTIKTK